MVKTQEQVCTALVTHTFNMRDVLSSPERLKETAKRMGWTEDRVKGYLEGVEWAYKWMLEEELQAELEDVLAER